MVRRALCLCFICVLFLSGCQTSEPVTHIANSIEDTLVIYPDDGVLDDGGDDVDIDLPLLNKVVKHTPIADNEEGVLLEDSMIPLADNSILMPVASGVKQSKNDKAVIDYSNVSDGYVMVVYTAQTSKVLKAQVSCPGGDIYTYNITPSVWVAFPLSRGNGTYKVTIFENTRGNKYATVLSVSFSVTLTDEFAPFIRPNQYVNYANAPKTIAKAVELTSNQSTTIAKVEAVYDWVTGNLTYDRQLAQTVSGGYLPVLDSVLSKKKGICFDYAALMSGMLRSQGVPCKLIVGYAGTAYHAWISVYTESTGWIDNAIYFDGKVWHRMDPTFASTGNKNEEVMKYIGNGTNYLEKYCY